MHDPGLMPVPSILPLLLFISGIGLKYVTKSLYLLFCW